MAAEGATILKMERISNVKKLEERLAEAGNLSIGFVPTMGALHEGHLSLVERARAENDVVVVSVFVNPTQFNDPEDLRRYPRTPQEDIEKLARAGVDIVFMPTEGDIYPEPDKRRFDFGTLDKVMEGATRPGHFNGVAQVVSRLFDIVEPTAAYFGEKDFQQIAIVKAMVKKLGMGVEIVECPIVREADGLAMSSRNALLSPEHRRAAPSIFAALDKASRTRAAASVADTMEAVKREIEANPLLEVIYFNIVDAATLADVEKWDDAKSIQGCIAVQAGPIRLIDNVRFL